MSVIWQNNGVPESTQASYCADPEGWGPMSPWRIADFTPCFEDGVLSMIPVAFLFFAGGIRLHQLTGRPAMPSSITHNWLYGAKLATMSLLIFVSAGIAITKIRYLVSWADTEDIQVLSSFITVFALVFAASLHHFEFTRSRIASSVLLFFWLFVLVADAFKLRTIIESNVLARRPAEAILFFIQVALSAGIFGLELTPFPKSEYLLLDEDPNQCPEESSNIFSRLTFHWMTPMMKLGYAKYLNPEDLWALRKNDQSKTISDTFQRHWAKELTKEKPSLLRALVLTFGGPFAFAAIFKAGQDFLQILQPQLLKKMMQWVSSYSTDHPMAPERGVIIALMMFILSIIQTAMLHQYFQLCFVTGMRIRAGLVTSIYRKALVLSNDSRQKSTVGEIVNHMSVDAQRMMDLCTYFHIIWSGPFQIALCLTFLHQTMGPSIWAGVAILVLVIPVNTYLAKKMRTYQKTQMANKDSRIKLMNEILNGIKVIKLYAWESSFMKKITYVRNDLELAMLKKIGMLAAIQNFTWASIPLMVSLSTFAVYVLVAHQKLTAETAFVAISLFNLLQFPLQAFPNVISSMIEAVVSLYRIEEFLSAEELNPDNVNKKTFKSGGDRSKATMVDVTSASFRWNKDSAEPILTDIDLKVDKGELLAIVGRVGAGKSSLISALLGDMEKSGGQVVTRGKVAYVPQQAWIMNATLRDNVVFGHRFDPAFYEQTITACNLKPDIAMLPGGDETEIGERGINLSGGQKARISLARAVYARADIYLLDDPLSAVDAHVGRWIFDKVIGPEGLLKSKARVLVTHGIAYLPKVDSVIMLKDGKIALSGNYNELMSRKTELYQLVSEFGRLQAAAEVEDEEVGFDSEEQTAVESTGSEDDLKQIEDDEDGEFNAVTGGGRERLYSTSSTKTLRRASLATLGEFKRTAEDGKDHLMTKEESAKGSVDWKVYGFYAKACSLPGVIAFLVFMIIAQACQVGSNLFLKYWSSDDDSEERQSHVWVFLGIYAVIGFASALFTVIQTIIMWVYCAIQSAKHLHTDMLESVVRSPMSFFDTTPMGRILNRFSKDQHTVDEVLPRTFSGYFRTAISVLSTLTVISFSTPLFTIVLVPLMFLYRGIQRYYLATSRELKRLDSVSRSPIYSHFQESISGASSIRAYQQENRFIWENEYRLDENQKAYFPSVSSNRWLAVRLEFIGSIIILGAAGFAVLSVLTGGNIDAGIVGLSLSYAISVTQALNWVIRQFCEIETNIVSVERIKEYVDLPSEAPAILKDQRPSHMWPDKGYIEYKDYATRYRAGLDLVLKNVNFKIAPREKVGIVGRTGAGKSSLTLSLFRLIEAAEGSIIVDGVDISEIGLYDLRSRLTIIPQDPVLFAGTVRDNLDPFEAYDDVQIWQALQSSHLKDHISKLEGKLNAPVLEGGENFSVGQRQLVCLARALLRRTPILILDEATAAIDVETDAIIQETIRREFSNCTILTIAHRINTILDSDRILVLDAGRIAEFDSPKQLLSQKDSLFYSLAKEAGHAA